MIGDDGVHRLEEVRRRLATYAADPDRVSDEDLEHLRRDARAAIDRLDDAPEFALAHSVLDEVGALVRRVRPHLCLLAARGDNFAQECPVDLGHIRLGLSVGFEIEESHCSICLGDLWECPHLPGETYDGQPVVRVITKANLIETSIVDRPDFPDARFTDRPISRVAVEQVFGALPDGARPVCGRCLNECGGVTRQLP